MTSPREGAARPVPNRVESLRVLSYHVEKQVMIEARGFDAWAVVDAIFVLNREGEWEYEPQPSNRSDEFLARTRFATAQEALDQWHSAGPSHEGRDT